MPRVDSTHSLTLSPHSSTASSAVCTAEKRHALIARIRREALSAAANTVSNTPITNTTGAPSSEPWASEDGCATRASCENDTVGASGGLGGGRVGGDGGGGAGGVGGCGNGGGCTMGGVRGGVDGGRGGEDGGKG